MSGPIPRRLVIDPNVLVSGAITPRGASARIIELINIGEVIAVASPKLVEELSIGLHRPKFRRYLDIPATYAFIDEFTSLADSRDDPESPAVLTPDPKDDYLVALALEAGVDALVSGDSDLADLSLPRLQVLAPRALLDRLGF